MIFMYPLLGLFKSTIDTSLSLPYTEWSKNASLELFHDKVTLRSITSITHSIVGLVSLYIISYLLKNLFYTNNRKNFLFLLVIVVYFVKIITILLQYKISSILFIVVGIINAIINCKGLLFSTIMTDLTHNNFDSKDREKIYLYNKTFTFLAKFILFLAVFIFTEYEIVHFLPSSFMILLVITWMVIVINHQKSKTIQRKGNNHYNFKFLFSQTIEPEHEQYTIKNINVKNLIISLLAYSLYWSQSNEYYYTYLFQKDDLSKSDKWIRIATGLQYFGFFISTFTFAHIKNKWVLPITIGASVIARIFQCVAYHYTSEYFWYVSAVISMICPPAGELLSSTVNANLNDSTYCVLFVKLTSLAFNSMLVLLYRQLYTMNFNPFLITFTTMTLTFILVITFKNNIFNINGGKKNINVKKYCFKFESDSLDFYDFKIFTKTLTDFKHSTEFDEDSKSFTLIVYSKKSVKFIQNRLMISV